jgi:hypothetical protein
MSILSTAPHRIDIETPNGIVEKPALRSINLNDCDTEAIKVTMQTRRKKKKNLETTFIVKTSLRTKYTHMIHWHCERLNTH